MSGGDLSSYLFRRPFVPFQFLLQGGYTVTVRGPEYFDIGKNFESFLVWDRKGRETLFDRDAIIGLRTLMPITDTQQ